MPSAQFLFIFVICSATKKKKFPSDLTFIHMIYYEVMSYALRLLTSDTHITK